jgi:hypothetical protein
MSRVTLSVRIQPLLKDRLAARAKLERRSVGSTLEMLLEEALATEPGEVVPPAVEAVPVPISVAAEAEVGSERKPPAKTRERASMCEHRVPVGAFCGRCDA